MTDKLPEINYDKPIWSLFPMKEKRARAGRCVDCNEPITSTRDFKDDLSVREYSISGLCQKCQDAVFR